MMKIKILKKAEYTPRKDRKKHHWFRVDNKIPFSRSLSKLDPDQRWFWICLLAFSSEEQSDLIDYDVEYFVKHTGLDQARIEAAIKLLIEAQSIQVLGKKNGNRSVTSRLPVGDRAVTERCPTDIHTDIHTYIDAYEKKFPCLPELNECAEYIATVSPKTQKNWLNLLDPKTIVAEIQKAQAWESADPRRTKKSRSKFLTNWLIRAKNAAPLNAIPATNGEVAPYLDLLNQAFNSAIPPRIERCAGNIHFVFKTPEKFFEWLEGVLTNPKTDPKKNPGWMQYLEHCILRQIGEIQ